MTREARRIEAEVRRLFCLGPEIHVEYTAHGRHQWEWWAWRPTSKNSHVCFYVVHYPDEKQTPWALDEGFTTLVQAATLPELLTAYVAYKLGNPGL